MKPTNSRGQTRKQPDYRTATGRRISPAALRDAGLRRHKSTGFPAGVTWVRAVVGFCSLLAIVSIAPAQKVPPAAPLDEPVVLSPFVLTADSEVGYTSTSTLAGSRIKTDFKDIASQISVMTPEFLADIGAFTNDDAFLYSINTETGAELAGTATEFYGGSGIGNSAPNRTRGLGGASNTRNFFETDIPNDVYNTGDGGLTIASGPNAILFGLGAPAGLTDARYNTAQLARFKSRLTFATDANGTRRGAIDYNQPLIRDRLGVRLDLLDSDRRFALKPAYEKDRRIFGTLGFAPNRRIRFDLSTELMDRQSSRPVYLQPRDAITLWVNPGVGNRTPYNEPDKTPTGNTNINILPNTGYLGGWTAGDTLAPAYTYGAHVAQPGVYSYRYYPAVRQFGTYLLNGIRVATNFNSGATVNDDRLYPFGKYNVYGASHPSSARAKRVTGQVTINLARNLNFEGAANFENYRDRSVMMYRPLQAQLNIDPSAYLYKPGYTPLDPIAAGTQQAANRAANAANRGVNPMLGTMFVEGQQIGTISTSLHKDVRTSLAYLFDATTKYRGGWLAWLGRHNLSTNLSYNEAQNVGQSFQRLIKDDGAVNPATGFKIAPSVITAANAMDSASKTGRYMVAANRQFRTRAYIDPADPANRYDNLGGLDPFGTWSFNDAAGKPYQVGLFDLGGGTNVANGRSSTDLSKSVAWQAFLLKNRMVVTYGHRWDSVRLKEFDAAASAIDPNTGLAPIFDSVPWQRYTSLPTFENTSKSIVVHPLPWVSLFYNLSTNSAAESSTAHDINGALYPVPTGDNKDYGLRVQLGGVGLRINQFRTVQQNTNAGLTYGNTGFKTNLIALEARYLGIQRLRAEALGQPVYADYYMKSGANPGFNAIDSAADYFQIYTDSLAKGTEIELTGRIRKFDLRVAAGRTQSIKSNLGPQWLNYLVDPVMFQRMESLEWYAYDSVSRQNRPVVAVSPAGQMTFGSLGAKPIPGWQNISQAESSASFGTSMSAFYADTVLPFALRPKQFEGMSNPAIREWRFSSTCAYNFSAGWRGGFSTRLRARALVGYATQPVTMEIAGRSVTSFTSDLSAPLYNENLWYFDPFLSYTTRIGKERRLTARLNVKNVLNRREMIITQKYSSSTSLIDVNDPRLVYYGWKDPNAIPSLAQVQDPREIALSLAIEF